MTYKYLEEILNLEKVIDITNTNNEEYEVDEYKLKLYPAYFNSFGNILYTGIDHINANINHKLISLIFSYFLSEVFPLGNIVEDDYKALYNDLKLKRHHDKSKLSVVDLSNVVNCSVKPYTDGKLSKWESSNIFTKDAMDLCNSMNEHNYSLRKILLELKLKTNNDLGCLKSLFNILQINYSKLLFKRADYIPFVDDSNLIQNYILWENALNKLVIDFYVMYIGLDKIESINRKAITTSKKNIYETFFNYFIMDFNIVSIPRIIFDENKNEFYFEKNSFITTSIEKEYEKEINLIRKKVKCEDRKNYFI